jgi:hypothetical protein
VESVEIMQMDELFDENVISVDENLFVVRMIQILRQSRPELKHFIMKQNLD